jgi:hypothetical protein
LIWLDFEGSDFPGFGRINPTNNPPTQEKKPIRAQFQRFTGKPAALKLHRNNVDIL